MCVSCADVAGVSPLRCTAINQRDMIKKLLLAITILTGLKLCIDYAKHRRLQKAREYYRRTNDIEKTKNTFNINPNDL